MVLRSMEGQIEEYVEGLMARVFGSGLQPVEIGRRLRRVAVRDRRVNVKGVATAANHFVVELGPADHNRIVGQSPSIIKDLIDEVRSAAAKERLSLSGQVSVSFAVDEDRRPGTFSIASTFDDSAKVAVPAVLELTDGTTMDLGPAGARIGRHHDNEVVIDETNVSRFHAQLLPTDTGWQIVDQGSTNGTRVNGQFVTRGELNDGDVLSVGPATFTFRTLETHRAS